MPEETNPQSNISEENIADNLLIKDNSGKLHFLDQDKKDVIFDTSIVKPASQVAQEAKVPEDDHFLAAEQNSDHNDQDLAHFSFHPDDQKEVELLAKNLPQDDSKKYSLEKIIDKLISGHKLKLDLAMKAKFSQIIFDFFRNRKNAIIVRENLSENVFEGEKVLSEETVNSLVSIIKTIKNDIDQAGGLVVKAEDLKAAQKNNDVQAEQPELAEDLSKAVADLHSGLPTSPVEELEKELNAEISEENPEKDEEEKIGVEATQGEIENILSDLNQGQEEKKDEVEDDSAEEIASPNMEAPVSEAQDDKANKSSEEEIKEPEKQKAEDLPIEKEEAPVELESLPKVFRPKANLAKKQLSDVTSKENAQTNEADLSMPVPPKRQVNLTGPIEELQNLSLENFRHLGNSPSEQIAKLFSKINLLEKDSVTKKAQGIEAWRNSPVYGHYLSLGEESLAQGKEVASIIKNKLDSNQETLTVEEFSAISDLNKNLRF
ncbi:hypothetical protein H6761_02610 [Candidatus Nomurabacteria bacterium]|nr:hypothetical protein [Candidatus Nomurabacteria bacterium]